MNKSTSIQDKIVKLCFNAMKLNRPFHSNKEVALFFEKQQKVNRQALKLPKTKSKIAFETIAGFPVYTVNSEYKSEKAIIYLHGGAYVYQPFLQHWNMLDRVSLSSKLPIIVPVYPKTPEYHFDTAYNYLEQVYRQAALKYRHIIFMGDSAGGGFALGFAQYCQRIGLPQPDKLILISPWIDLSMSNPDIEKYKKADVFLSVSKLRHIAEKWAGETNLSDYRLSPLHGNLDDLPPITIFVGTHEVFLPDIRVLKARLLSANNLLHYYEKEKMLHTYPLFPIPEAKEAQNIIIEELK